MEMHKEVRNLLPAFYGILFYVILRFILGTDHSLMIEINTKFQKSLIFKISLILFFIFALLVIIIEKFVKDKIKWGSFANLALARSVTFLFGIIFGIIFFK